MPETDLSKIELTREQLGLLAIIGTQWSTDPSGKWPMWHWVEDRARAFGIPDPQKVLESLPRVGAPSEFGSHGLSYGFTTVVPRRLEEESEIALTVAASLPLQEAGSPLGDPFIRVLLYMIALWRSTPRSPNEIPRVTLTSAELHAAMPDLPDATLRRIPSIFRNEPFLFLSGGTAPDTSWSLEIPRDILRYEQVTGIQQYVSAASYMVEQNAQNDRMFGFRNEGTGIAYHVTVGSRAHGLLPSEEDQAATSTPEDEEAIPAVRDGSEEYIDPGLIELWESASANSTKWSTERLSGLARELNANYAEGRPLSCLALIRAIMDHVPPFFGAKTFSEVIATMDPGRRSNDRDHIKVLSTYRFPANDVMHRQAAARTPRVTMQELPQRMGLDALLSRVVDQLRAEDSGSGA